MTPEEWDDLVNAKAKIIEAETSLIRAGIRLSDFEIGRVKAFWSRIQISWQTIHRIKKDIEAYLEEEKEQ